MNSDSDNQSTSRKSAIELARHKLDDIYASQQTISSEIDKSADTKPLSKHQAYMQKLSSSGKPLAQIQTDWHKYYSELDDKGKNEVWQEFYADHSRKSTQNDVANTSDTPYIPSMPPRYKDNSKPTAIRKRILNQLNIEATKEPKTRKRQKLESIFFGLGVGVIAIIIFLFGFFNEYIIAPFIQPGRLDSATPVILDTGSAMASKNPEVIIPKIGVQIPVDYSLQTVNENDIQTALDEGVVHYANTVKPGQIGNTAIFGHSSNNIFNKGKYKFAFVLLHKMEEGDVFYLSYNQTLYAYRVFKKQVVSPDETWVLGPVADKATTATLITCDPPGSVQKRLVVWGEQISPDPIQNKPVSPSEENLIDANQPYSITGKGPNALARFWRFLNPFD